MKIKKSRVKDLTGKIFGELKVLSLWVHKKINLLKGALGESEFIRWCKLLIQKNDKKYIAITSGYWAPIHSGHITLFEKASWMGHHICIVNNDEQTKIKQSIPFMNESERLLIVSSMRCVDEAILSIDTDNTVHKTLKFIRDKYPHSKIVFCNGGDQVYPNMLEKSICDQYDIEMLFGIGGADKTNSSSQLIENASVEWLKQNVDLYQPPKVVEYEGRPFGCVKIPNGDPGPCDCVLYGNLLMQGFTDKEIFAMSNEELKANFKKLETAFEQ